MYCVNVELTKNKFKEFYDSGDFVDCILKISDFEIKCHKIVLAKNSSFFNNFFKNKELHEITTINLDFSSKEAASEIINSLYSGLLNVTNLTLIPLLAFATKYEFSKISSILDEKLNTMIYDSTILHIASEIDKYNLCDTNESCFSKLAELFYNNNTNIKREDVYKKLSPYAFSILLKQKVFIAVSDIEKVEFIESYCSFHGLLNEREKHYFDDLLDWSKENSFLFVLRYSCEWIPANISRSLYIKAINARREAVQRYSKQVQEAINESKMTFSRWYTFSTFNQIQKNPLKPHSSGFDLISYVSTLGGNTNLFNPIKYGLISVKSSTTFNEIPGREPYFGPQNAIIPNDLYFIGIEQGNLKPWISIDFGPNANIIFTDVGINSYIPRSEDRIHEKPGAVSISVGENYNTTTNLNAFKNNPSRCVVIRMTKNGEHGTDKLRIKKIDISGFFTI